MLLLLLSSFLALPQIGSAATSHLNWVPATYKSYETEPTLTRSHTGGQLVLANDVKTEMIMPETYEIMTNEGGTLTTIGIIAFDEGNNGELTMLTDSDAGKRLKDQWTVISGYPEIDFENGGARQQEDGSWVHFTEFVKVGKDNPDYPIVAMQFLQLHHGYRFVLRPAIVTE